MTKKWTKKTRQPDLLLSIHKQKIYDIQLLADKYECDPKTIKRDLKDLGLSYGKGKVMLQPKKDKKIVQQGKKGKTQTKPVTSTTKPCPTCGHVKSDISVITTDSMEDEALKLYNNSNGAEKIRLFDFLIKIWRDKSKVPNESDELDDDDIISEVDLQNEARAFIKTFKPEVSE